MIPFPQPATPGQRLRRERRLRELTQAQLAQRLGRKASTVAHWEADHHRPSLQAALRLKQLLGIPLSVWEEEGQGNGAGRREPHTDPRREDR